MVDVNMKATSWCYKEMGGLEPLPEHYAVFDYGHDDAIIGMVLVDMDSGEPLAGPFMPNSMFIWIMDMRKHLKTEQK